MLHVEAPLGQVEHMRPKSVSTPPELATAMLAGRLSEPGDMGNQQPDRSDSGDAKTNGDQRPPGCCVVWITSSLVS